MKARPFSMLMQSRELSMSLPVVYVNYELLEDYETLKQMGLNVSVTPLPKLRRRLVILGIHTHRDAWTFGAVGPNSGTAALLEIRGCPVYHSIYDDFIWMQKFGDSMFHRHVTVASVWDLVALWLADAEFLPFNDLSHIEGLGNDISDMNINLTPLFKSIEELKRASTEINNRIKNKIKVGSSRGRKIILKVRELNDRLTMAEPAFTDQDGLFGRSYYKHLIYGPSKHDDYGSISFPGIDEGIEMSWKSAT
ncbi:hypothetical protein ACFX1S_018042 [Malus domestica]